MAKVNRLDHFADSRSPEEPPREPNPGLEYDKYRITPVLIEHLKANFGPPNLEPAFSMDSLIFKNAQWAIHDGTRAVIRRLEVLMSTQDEDQA